MDTLRPENRGASRLTIYIAAFFLPVALFFAVCACLGLVPFGSASALDLDLPNQYLCYFSYLPSVASGENDLIYSFSKTLGGDMISMLAYYFLSPLNAVFLFTSLEALPLAITCVIAAKLGLCGLSFAACAIKRRPDASVLIFSTGYALMSYNITYASNLMWLDAVYLLPVIVLGIDRVVSGRSPVLYAVSLAACLFVNYYIGYMVCIFSVIYFVFRLLAAEKGSVRPPRAVLRFALASLLAGGLAAVVLVPTFLSLSGTKAAVSGDLTSLSLVYTPRDLIRKLFSCSVLANGEVNVAPNIYCGILTTAFLPLYFANGKISRRERLASAGLLAVLLVTMAVRGAYIIWHAFAMPAGFPQRCSFVVGFVLSALAYRAFCALDGVTRKRLAVIIAALLAVATLGAVFTSLLADARMLLDIAFILLAFAALFFMGRALPRRVAVLILAAIQLATLFENAVFLRQHPHSASLSLDYDTYLAQTAPAEAAVSAIKARDGGFYRVAEAKNGDEYAHALNAPMKYAYNGVSHFDSTEKSTVKRFMAALGYASYNNYWASYSAGATASADSLLGIKYVYSEAASHGGYNAVPTDGGMNVFENADALPLAFVADSAVLAASLDSPNPFENQNAAYSAVLGQDAAILRPVSSAEEELENLTATLYDGFTLYERADYDAPCAIRYVVTPASDGALYAHATFPDGNATVELETADVYVNGVSIGALGGIYDRGVKLLGSFAAGESVEVTLVPRSNVFVRDSLVFCSESPAALSAAVADIRQNAANAVLEKLSSSRLRWSGEVRADGAVLLLTLPYERGWRATVDGAPAELRPALGVLAALEFSAGAHVVELEYTPPGAYIGLGITAVSLLALALYLARRRACKKPPQMISYPSKNNTEDK